MSITPIETTKAPTRCEECGVPAAADQRYCLNCGAHISDVPDPVARYLSEASAARARVALAVARSAAAQRSRRLPRLSAASAIVLVIVALVVGIAIGHTSSGTATSATSTKVTSTKSAGGSSKKGSSAVDKVAKSTGKSYVQQENNLPTSVTP